MTAQRSPIARDLRGLAGRYHLGAFLNAVDEVGKAHGGDQLPAATYKAAMALWAMLADLGLTDAGTDRAADVWRSP